MERMIFLGVSYRRVALIFLDAVVVCLVFFLGFLLRFDFNIPSSYLQPGVLFNILGVSLLSRLGMFYYFGLYKRLWHYASLDELKMIVVSTTLSSGLIGTFFFLNPNIVYPRSILAINWALTILFIGGSRFSWRLWRERPKRQKLSAEKPEKKILIYGAGDAGEMVIRELKKHGELNYNVMGIIDDDPGKKGMEIHGIKVLGNRHSLKEVIKKKKIEEVIIAIPTAPGTKIREINSLCREEGLDVRILPGMFELLSGEVDINQLREVRVDDLLRRDPIKLDNESICSYLEGKSILVTGGGGSIGSELIRQIAHYKPEEIILFDVSENSVFHVSREVKSLFPGIKLVSVVGTIQDRGRVREVFATHRPQVIFHAAAYKHVPLMETNASEAVKNNIFGTINVSEEAHNFAAECFVLISSDKAVNPANVMGATKRIAEMVIQAKNNQSKTDYVAVRFGNVLGSEGSAIPLFKEQIKEGGPLTITHPEVTRYFMTIPEAVQLVIQAGAMARGGEIFILDMGEPVKIVDLARDLIRLSGLEPEKDIPITFIGLRPGEKMFEELILKEEDVLKTEHDKIFVSKPLANDFGKFSQRITELEKGLAEGNEKIVEKIKEIIPEFSKQDKWTAS